MTDAGAVVVAGAGGLLGAALMAQFAARDPVPLSRDALAVSDPAALRARLAALRPALVLNCAADTDVEGSEADPDRAYAANALLPGLLAAACAEHGARLVHFSSTGCYGDWKRGPYADWDPLRPTTVHHAAKAAGEEAVRRACPSHLILRLGWLYGGEAAARRNFVAARLREAAGRDEIVSDPSQTGNPTHVADVAAQVARLVEAGLVGTFNCVAAGSASRFEYVARILEFGGLPTRLRPRRFERRAPVSPNEAAENRALALLGLDAMPEWGEALGRYVASLGALA